MLVATAGQRAHVINRLCGSIAVHARARGQDRGIDARGHRAGYLRSEFAGASAVVPSALICRQLFRVLGLPPAGMTFALLADKALAARRASTLSAQTGLAVAPLAAECTIAPITDPIRCYAGMTDTVTASERLAAGFALALRRAADPAARHRTAERLPASLAGAVNREAGVTEAVVSLEPRLAPFGLAHSLAAAAGTAKAIHRTHSFAASRTVALDAPAIRANALSADERVSALGARALAGYPALTSRAQFAVPAHRATAFGTRVLISHTANSSGEVRQNERAAPYGGRAGGAAAHGRVGA